MGKLGLKLRVVICFEQMLVLRLQFFGGTKDLYRGSIFFWDEQKACAQALIFCELSKKLVLRLGFLWTEQKACAQARILVNWAKSLCSGSDFFLAEQKAPTQARGGHPGLSISDFNSWWYLLKSWLTLPKKSNKEKGPPSSKLFVMT